MLKVLRIPLHQRHPTLSYPRQASALPDRFPDRPVIDSARCPAGCRACVEACPTDAILQDELGLRLDLGCCLFCLECVNTCPRLVTWRLIYLP